MAFKPTEEQCLELEAKLDAAGAQRPYVRVMDGAHLYIMSERDWLRNKALAESADG